MPQATPAVCLSFLFTHIAIPLYHRSELKVREDARNYGEDPGLGSPTQPSEAPPPPAPVPAPVFGAGAQRPAASISCEFHEIPRVHSDPSPRPQAGAACTIMNAAELETEEGMGFNGGTSECQADAAIIDLGSQHQSLRETLAGFKARRLALLERHIVVC